MRRAMVRISNEILAEILRGQWRVRPCVWTDAPADLTVVGVGYAPAGQAHIWFYAIVESETFDEVEQGQQLPELPPFTYRSA
jgi:hypothetical protein